MKSLLRTTLLIIAVCAATFSVVAAESLIGTTPREWQVTNWMNSTPLKLSDLRGKVVLIRWWTAPDCPYCRATAPALNEFYSQYHARSLEVLGFYHHKGKEPLRPADVNKYATDFGFKFPWAIDADWKTLHQWWLDAQQRNFTSVTFLLDRSGKIRHIHPGGEYVKGDKDYAAMKRQIEKLLAEK